jgi:hypothetical protein
MKNIGVIVSLIASLSLIGGCVDQDNSGSAPFALTCGSPDPDIGDASSMSGANDANLDLQKYAFDAGPLTGLLCSGPNFGIEITGIGKKVITKINGGPETETEVEATAITVGSPLCVNFDTGFAECASLVDGILDNVSVLTTTIQGVSFDYDPVTGTVYAIGLSLLQ